MTKSQKIIIQILIIVFFSSCSSNNDMEIYGYKCSNLIDGDNSVLTKQTQKQFYTFNINKQYATIMCDRRYHYAHHIVIIDDSSFTDRGESVVRFLENELKMEVDEQKIEIIIGFFNIIEARESYDIYKDKNIMHLIEIKIYQLENNNYKKSALQFLESIKVHGAIKHKQINIVMKMLPDIQDDFLVLGTVRQLKEMYKTKKYDIKENQEIINIIESRMTKMDNKYVQEDALKILNEIKTGKYTQESNLSY